MSGKLFFILTAISDPNVDRINQRSSMSYRLCSCCFLSPRALRMPLPFALLPSTPPSLLIQAPLRTAQERLDGLHRSIQVEYLSPASTLVAALSLVNTQVAVTSLASIRMAVPLLANIRVAAPSLANILVVPRSPVSILAERLLLVN